jgi:hypothetical protein
VTREWICSLQLLLGLTRAFILGFESRRPHDHILLSQIWDSPNLQEQILVFISPGTCVKLCPKSRYNWRSVSLSVCPDVEPLLVLMTRCLLLFDDYCCVFVGRPLWREQRNRYSNWIFFTLKMEATRSSETLVITRPTRRHVPDDGTLHSHRWGNLKSYRAELSSAILEQSRSQWERK